MTNYAYSNNLDKKADRIIAKYVEAIGLNKPNIETVSYLMEQKQTIFIDGQNPNIIESYTIAAPLENKYYSKINSLYQMTSVFNGTDGWIETNDNVIEYNNHLKETTLLAIHHFKGLKFDKEFYDTEYIGESTFEGKRVHKIKVKNKFSHDTGDLYAYFDARTGLYVLGENIRDGKTYKTKILNYTDAGEGILIPTLAVESNGKIISTLETFRIVLGYPLENIDFSRQAVQHKFDAWQEYEKGLNISTTDRIKALTHFNNAIKANPNFIKAHEARIELFFYLERYNDVLESCRILKGIQPQNLEAIRMEAFTLARLEQIEQARIANERYLAKLEEERKQREKEEHLRKEKQERIYALEEENRQMALKLQTALNENASIEKENIKKEEKKAKRKKFWNNFWKGLEIATTILETTNNTIAAINNISYSKHSNYDYRGSYSAKSKLVKTKTCSTCKGTGMNLLSKERPPFYTSGNVSSTTCNYCNDITIHYHGESPSCRGKGEITTLN